MIVITDLEGVLIPEIWEEVARETGVEGLAATTHDEPDFGRLMDHRVELLARHDIRLDDLTRIAATVQPYDGASEFLAWARRRAQVMIASDSFHELSESIVLGLGGYSLFANTFKVDREGRILGYRLRIRGRKDNVIRNLKEIGFHIVAIGDGYNDEYMFRVANEAILFRAPADLVRRIPEGQEAANFDDLRRIIAAVHEELARSQFEPAK